jgi:plasmid stabilization system protein ParE
MARDDLPGIVRHVGKSSPLRARNPAQEIREKVGGLAQHSNIGRPRRFEGMRELVAHPNHVIFYRVKAKTRSVEILRVRHAAQQLP